MPGRAWAAGLLIVAGAMSPAAAQPALPDHPPPILGAPVLAAPVETARPNVAPFPPVARTPVARTPVALSTIPAGYVDPPEDPAATPPQAVRAARLGLPIASDDGSSSISGDAAWPPIGMPRSQPPAAPESEFLFRQAQPPQQKEIDLARLFGSQSNKSSKPDWNIGKLFDSKSNWQPGDYLSGLFPADWYRSDHAFDGFISPITNPFLFEDPRSLTEVRPVVIYQKMPDAQVDFRGGSTTYFGLQGRLHITDSLSFVFNKLGGIWVSPGSGSNIDSQAGFSELWFGPKYTFIRNEQTGTIAAGGLQFQVPVGSQSAFQNNGTLSLVPYVSAAQNLFRDFSAGSFNVMGTTGYQFSMTPARSDYYYLSGHIDMDVLNTHHFYPLFEMNWFMMTTSGNSTAIGSEGRDLINFGGQAAGKGLLTGAFGARYKFTECMQLGGAFEIPFAGPRDLFLYRFTFDFILRY